MTNKIKEKRIEKGMTRKQLAELAGINYTKLADYENNYIKTENAVIGNFYRIAKALECTIDELIEE